MTEGDFKAKMALCVGKPDECWEWKWGRVKRGYGQANINGRCFGTHRLAYHYAHGWPLDSPLHVLHACDNPPCINPRHLRLGTHADNMADMHAKGRDNQARGPRVLTADQCQEIRTLRTEGATLRELAAWFGVSTKAIRNVPDLGARVEREPEPWRPSPEHLRRMAANLAAMKAGEPRPYPAPYVEESA